MLTIGEFYKENILGRIDLYTRDLSEYNGETRVEKDLFGWKLYLGKSFIECSSGEEARYMKVFFDTGKPEVDVPADKEFLKSIVPELERLKRRMDEIINFFVDTIRSRKIREQIKYEVYQENIK
ncbi:MAG: hypothetical protein KAW12_01000 [Candidatus Aminicenantes bacterium]|nr:hypothetical protein [Candidatus Aminicenantes bacterium]